MAETHNIPEYAKCPHHVAEHVEFNISIEMYQCLAPTQQGQPGFVKDCTRYGNPVCAFQAARRYRKPTGQDLGGAFDGVRVTSDADGGL